MKKTPFKMKGFSGFGNSPLKQNGHTPPGSTEGDVLPGESTTKSDTTKSDTTKSDTTKIDTSLLEHLQKKQTKKVVDPNKPVPLPGPIKQTWGGGDAMKKYKHAKAKTLVTDKHAKKFSKKASRKMARMAAKKVAGKLATRAIPYVGWGLLAKDVYGTYKKVKSGKTVKQALKSQFLGMD